jgi:DedD protein
MAMAAQSLAPVISRMEPLGRTLTNPKKTTPKPSVAPKPKLPTPPTTPAPVAPPVNAQATTQKATPEAIPKTTPKEAAPKPEAEDPTKVAKWTVLLGAFGSQENAINLKARLEAAGLPVAISEVMEKNKLWYRLNSGLFDDRETAEAYSRELRQKKLVERPYVKRL